MQCTFVVSLIIDVIEGRNWLIFLQAANQVTISGLHGFMNCFTFPQIPAKKNDKEDGEIIEVQIYDNPIIIILLHCIFKPFM